MSHNHKKHIDRISKPIPDPSPFSLKDAYPVNLFVLLEEDQNEVLRQNGLPENHGKNHEPYVHVALRVLGFTYLLTEKVPDKMNVYYGLCRDDKGLKIGYVDFSELHYNHYDVWRENFRIYDWFWPQYPLAVYAGAANLLGTVTTDNQSEGLRELFHDNIDDETMNKEMHLESFRSRFPEVKFTP